jgi:ankyrin repeat protein
MANNKQAVLQRMRQPRDLTGNEPLLWSYGRGTDVWDLFGACITGDLPTVQRMIEKDPPLVNARFEYFPPLHFAVREGHPHIAKYLVEQGADTLQTGGDSLITMATDRGFTELAELFTGIQRNKFHIVPEAKLVADAIKAYDLPTVQQLLAAQPELLHAADERGNQPIHWAVLTRQIKLIDYLLELGADINAKRPDGASPLDLTNGDYHYRSWYRDLPPTALQKHEVLIGYLVARGAYMDISVAAKLGYLDRVRELLDEDPSLANALPAYNGYYSGLPLRNAAGAGYMEVVKLLLQRGADPNIPEPGHFPLGSALFHAIHSKRTDIVRLLLEHDADPNAPGESSGNCMFIAKHIGAPKEIQDLLASYGGVMGAYFADVETLAAMLHANPQLYVEERLEEPQILQLILMHQPNYLKTPIDPSAWWSGDTLKSAEHARWLFDHGLDAKRCNWLGITLLHRCAINGDNGDPAVAAVCLDYSADIDAIDTEWNSTPLGWAARKGTKDMVAWFLQHGADPTLPKDAAWAQPIEWAKRRGHQEIVELLKK